MVWLVAALLAGALLTAPLVLFALVFGDMADRLSDTSRDFLMPANLLCAGILPALFNVPGLLLPLAALFYYDTAAGYSIAGLIAAYLLLLALLFRGKAGAFRSKREQDDVVWMNLAHSLRNHESFKTGGSDREFFSGSMSGCAGQPDSGARSALCGFKMVAA